MIPKFFLASNEEKAEWRRHPMSVALEEYLGWEEARVADDVLASVGDGRIDDAKRGSAILTALQALQSAIAQEKPVPSDTTDSTFVDPAAIWGDRKK